MQSTTGYGLFSANLGGHTLYLGLQKVSGDTSWMSVYGSSGRTLGNDMFNGNFSNADERSWQARYDYSFAAAGIPGLLLMTRYGYGDNATNRRSFNSDFDQTRVIVSYPLSL
ncbi:Porin-like protein NicP precursor [compost metagenome]